MLSEEKQTFNVTISLFFIDDFMGCIENKTNIVSL